jgi:hypothetical protein
VTPVRVMVLRSENANISALRESSQPCDIEQVFDMVEEWKSLSTTVRRFVQLHQLEPWGRTAVADQR